MALGGGPLRFPWYIKENPEHGNFGMFCCVVSSRSARFVPEKNLNGSVKIRRVLRRILFPKTNSKTLKISHPKRKGNTSSNHPFSGATSMLVSGGIIFKGTFHASIEKERIMLQTSIYCWVPCEFSKVYQPDFLRLFQHTELERTLNNNY